MAHVFGEKWKNNLIAREALKPLIFCKGMEHDAKGMEDSRWLLESTQKILKYSHHFQENSIKRNSLFIWEASKSQKGVVAHHFEENSIEEQRYFFRE